MSGGEVDALLSAPRWPADRVRTLPGRCRGSLLRSWADGVRRRWGDAGVATVREGLGPLSEALPDDPARDAWVPVAAQILATDLVIERLLGGDAAALEPLLHADTVRARDKVLGWVVRKVGPAAVYRASGRVHPHLYDVGSVEATVGAREVSLVWSGAALFECPTFHVLQLLGNRILLRMMGHDLVEVGSAPGGPGRFALDLRWNAGRSARG